MIRILSALAASAFAILSVSCGCCTSDALPPALRPLPQFTEIQTTTTHQVEYTK